MADFKKITAVCAAAAMAASLTGCSDTSYILEYSDKQVNAGVYIYKLYTNMSYQMAMLYYMQGVTENYFDEEVDGKKLDEYLSDEAKTSIREYAAIVEQFDSLGLELSEDDLKEVSDNVSSLWNNSGDLYEYLGISKESAKLSEKADKMRTQIFNYYYKDGGPEEVSDEEQKTYVEDNYLRYKYITFDKTSSDSSSSSEQADEDAKALRDEYLEKAQGISFEEFDQIIDEYNAYLAEAEDTSDSSLDIESFDYDSLLDEGEELETDSSMAADSAAEGDSPMASADLSSEEEAESDDSQASNESSEAGVTAEETSVEIETEDDSSLQLETDDDMIVLDEDAAEAEEDPYINEYMTNYGALDEEELEEDYNKLTVAVNDMEIGKAQAYEDDTAYYIVIRGDISERSEEYAQENSDTILSEMKDDDFQAKIDSWIEALDLKENSESFRRYTPKAIYERGEKYNEKHGTNNG